MLKTIITAAAMGVSLAAAGCALGLGGGAPETYDLSAPVAKRGPKTQTHITVAQPDAIRPLDNDQILVRDASGKLSYFPSSAWGDRLPRLVQTRLMQAMTDSGRFRAVGSTRERTPADVTLAVELRSFNIQMNGGRAEAVVDVVAKLLDERRDRVIATQQFSHTVAAGRDDAAAGVSALTEAFHRVSEEIVAWSANPRSA
ncbi:MAG: ABC-type transport auxiliary lipoprotein family protein [Hyphomicrobiales bacterium]|nr:ABC-type transport auxiliary lipoprotein family protein [Hyphomicrobiales bacterium]